jgi:uncharacterized protein YcnI
MPHAHIPLQQKVFSMKKNIPARVAAFGAAVAILVLGAPLAADAHVKVSPNTASAGDDIQLTFRVPNEMEDAGTVKVEIDLPTKTPFADAEYQPTPGWTAQIVTTKLAKPIKNDGVEVTVAPTKVIYTADPGTQIKAGQFQEFALVLDLTPDTGSVEFPTYQTYSNGKVVKWNEPTPKSGDEPDNPAPTLYINDPAPSDGSQGGLALVGTPDATASTANTALILGTAGLALAVIALVLGVFAFVRSRRQ